MTTKIAVSITGYSDGTKAAHLLINEQAIRVTLKTAKEVINKSGLKLRTDFGTPEGAKSYKLYL